MRGTKRKKWRAGYGSDAELLAACRRREIGAFEQLYRTRGARLKSVAYHIAGSRQDAEDAAGDVPQGVPRHRRFRRRFPYRHVALQDLHQCLLRPGPQAATRSATPLWLILFSFLPRHAGPLRATKT
jgi:hypothetical protein